MARRKRKIEAPGFVALESAREVSELPEGEDWLYEVKLDGYRGLGLKHGPNTRILSRKEKDLSADFPNVTDALKTIRAKAALIDGEIVALDEKGRPAFQLLQHRRSSDGPVVFYAFDLLHLNGEDWGDRPLEERKAKLQAVVRDSEVRFSASFRGPPEKLVEMVEHLGLEGVIAKRRDAAYGKGDWVKFKTIPEQEFVIGGFKPGAPLESLVVGYYEKKKLLCAGKVRQGLNPRNRRQLFELLRPLATARCPFSNLPNSRKSHWGEGITAEEMKELTWVRPQIVGQVRFTEWTMGGNLRHGQYLGIREDKRPSEVRRESP